MSDLWRYYVSGSSSPAVLWHGPVGGQGELNRTRSPVWSSTSLIARGREGVFFSHRLALSRPPDSIDKPGRRIGGPVHALFTSLRRNSSARLRREGDRGSLPRHPPPYRFAAPVHDTVSSSPGVSSLPPRVQRQRAHGAEFLAASDFARRAGPGAWPTPPRRSRRAATAFAKPRFYRLHDDVRLWRWARGIASLPNRSRLTVPLMRMPRAPKPRRTSTVYVIACLASRSRRRRASRGGARTRPARRRSGRAENLLPVGALGAVPRRPATTRMRWRSRCP